MTIRKLRTQRDDQQWMLDLALNMRGRVQKQRRLYLAGNTRIHLDRVEGLGNFVELEVVLREGETQEQGEATANRILDHLGIEASQLVAGAYFDLLLAND